MIITEDTAAATDEHAQLVFKFCQNMGFDPRIETINAAEAWLGSLPGQGWYDVRRPLVNTQNLADILPLTSIWPGLATNPCPYYPPDTPALCYGATSGSTPFRFNLHVSDTGHTAIFGPTGGGKSVALGTIAANFRAVPEGQVFFFDKGYSAFVLTKALGGQHLDLGEEEVPRTAFEIVFMIISIAVSHVAASIAGGTIGLALNHAFEAVFIARNVVQPITSALHAGSGKLARLGTAATNYRSEPASWINAMDFGHQTQKLNNLGPDGGFRVRAPKDVRVTSVIPPRGGAKTTAVSSGGSNSTTRIGKPTNKI